jgi:hypothetical protein
MLERGDKVIVNGKYDDKTFREKLGRVISKRQNHKGAVCIEFIENIEGHDGNFHDSSLRGKKLHCWWVLPTMCKKNSINQLNKRLLRNR